MQEYLHILKRSKLYRNMPEHSIEATAKCLQAKVKKYSKGTVIFHDGDEVGFVGIILSGEIETQKVDFLGNSNIVSRLFPSDVIAASACYSTDKRLPFDVVCVSDCEVFCLNTAFLISPCVNACAFHTTLIQNMLNIIADKNIVLAEKIDVLTKRSTREKILAYLFTQSKGKRNTKFAIPLSRRQMAEFLSVDRSALSRELSNLVAENIIEFDRNIFLLKN